MIKTFIQNSKLKIKASREAGQAMVMVTIIIGVLMASASAVSGLLTYYELRQATDTEESSMAFYAADAGMEKSLLCYFTFPGLDELGQVCDYGAEGGEPVLVLENTAEVSTDLECVDEAMNEVACGDNEAVTGFSVRSFGTAKDTERVLDTFFATKRNL